MRGIQIKIILTAIAGSAIIGGCTPQSQAEYKDAGKDLTSGVKTDVTVGAKAAKAAGDAAKKSLQQNTGSTSK